MRSVELASRRFISAGGATQTRRRGRIIGRQVKDDLIFPRARFIGNVKSGKSVVILPTTPAGSSGQTIRRSSASPL
jgi:hypothetical protein